MHRDLKFSLAGAVLTLAASTVSIDRIAPDTSTGNTIHCTIASTWTKVNLKSGSLTVIGLQTTPTADISGSLVLKGASSIAGTLSGSIVCADHCNVSALSITVGSITGLLSIPSTSTITCTGGSIGDGSLFTNISSPAAGTLAIGCPLRGPLSFDSSVTAVTLSNSAYPLDITSGSIAVPTLVWTLALRVAAADSHHVLNVTSVVMQAGDSIVLAAGANVFIAAASRLQGNITGPTGSPTASSFVTCNGNCTIAGTLRLVNGAVLGGVLAVTNANFQCFGGGGIGPVRKGELTGTGGIDFGSGSCVVRAPFPFGDATATLPIHWPASGNLTIDLSAASQSIVAPALKSVLIASGPNTLTLDQLVLNSKASIYAERDATIAITGASTLNGTLASSDRTGSITCGIGAADVVIATGDVTVSGATLRGTLNVNSPQRVFCTNNARLAAAFKTTVVASDPKPALLFVDCILSVESAFNGFELTGPTVDNTLTIDTTASVSPSPIPGLTFAGTVKVVGSNAISLSGVSFTSPSSSLIVQSMAGVSFDANQRAFQGTIGGTPNAPVSVSKAVASGTLTISGIALTVVKGSLYVPGGINCVQFASISGPSDKSIDIGDVTVDDCSVSMKVSGRILGPGKDHTLTLDSTEYPITIDSIDQWVGTIALKGSNSIIVAQSASISKGDASLRGSGLFVAAITLLSNGHVRFDSALVLVAGSVVAISAASSGSSITAPSVLTLAGTAALSLTNIHIPKLTLSGTGSFQLHGACSVDPVHFDASAFQSPINIVDGTLVVHVDTNPSPPPPFTFAHGVVLAPTATLAITKVLVTIPMGTLEGTVSSDSALNITASVGTLTMTTPASSSPIVLTGTMTVAGTLTIKNVQLDSTAVIKPNAAAPDVTALVLDDGAVVMGGAYFALNSVSVLSAATVTLDVTHSPLEFDKLSWAGTLSVWGRNGIYLGPGAATVFGSATLQTGEPGTSVRLSGSIASPSGGSISLPSIVILDDQWLNFSSGIFISAGAFVGMSNAVLKLSGCTVKLDANSQFTNLNLHGPTTSSLTTTFIVAEKSTVSLERFSWQAGTVSVLRAQPMTPLAKTPRLVFNAPTMTAGAHLQSTGIEIAITDGDLSGTLSGAANWSIDATAPGALTFANRMNWNAGAIRLAAASSLVIGNGVTVGGTASFGASNAGSLQLDGCDFDLSIAIPYGLALSGPSASAHTTVLRTNASVSSLQSMKLAGGEIEVRGANPLALTVQLTPKSLATIGSAAAPLNLTATFDDRTSALTLRDGMQLKQSSSFAGFGSLIAANITFVDADTSVSFSAGVQIQSGAWGVNTKTGAVRLNDCSVSGSTSFLAPTTGPGAGSTATIRGGAAVQFEHLTLLGGILNAAESGAVSIATLTSAGSASNSILIGSLFTVASATMPVGGSAWSLAGAGTVSGRFSVATGAALSFGGGLLLDSSFSATGGGSIVLDSCTINGGAVLQSTHITGPATGQRLVLKSTAGASIHLPQLSGWGGEVRLSGTAGAGVELSNAQISGKSAKLSYASSAAVPLTGSIDIAGFGLNIQSGRVSTAGALRFKSSTKPAALALNSIEVSSADSRIVLGSGIVARPTLLTGLGTVQFDGCDVALPPYLDLFTGSLAGPSIGETTTIKISDATTLPPFAVAGAVMIDVDPIVIEGATLQLTFSDLSMTESTASISTTATVRVPGSAEFVAPSLTVQSGALRGRITAPPNTATAQTELSIAGTVRSGTELRISSGLLSGSVTVENGTEAGTTSVRFAGGVIVDALTVQNERVGAVGTPFVTVQFGDSTVRSVAAFPLAASFAGPLTTTETATFLIGQSVRSLSPFAHATGTVAAIGTGSLDLTDYTQQSGAVLAAAGAIRVTRGVLNGRTTVDGVYDPALTLTNCVVTSEIAALKSAEIDCSNTVFKSTAKFTDSGDSTATPSVRLDACTIDPAVTIAPNIGFLVGTSSSIGANGHYRSLTVEANAVLTIAGESSSGLKLDSITLNAPCSVAASLSNLLVIASKTASFEFTAPASINLNGVSLEPTAACTVVARNDALLSQRCAIDLSGGASVVAGTGLSISTPDDPSNSNATRIVFRSDAGAVPPVSSVLLFGNTAFQMDAAAASRANTIQMDGVCYMAEAADSTLPAALNATGATANAKCSYFDGCASSPCAGGGKCHNRRASYECTCPVGFTGSVCQTNSNGTTSLLCCVQTDTFVFLFAPQNARRTRARLGVCTDGADGYTCACQPGTSGVRCETNLDECASNPCLSGGSCVDRVNGFECVCAAGYFGPICAGELNECASSPCANGGLCVDGLGHFTCTCRLGFNPPQCLTCSGCNTTAECVATDATPSGMICACPTDRTGARCQFPAGSGSGARGGIALAADEFELVLSDEIAPSQFTPHSAAAIVAKLVADAGATAPGGAPPVNSTDWMFASAIRIDPAELVHVWVTVELAKWTGAIAYPIERLSHRIGSGDVALAGLNILSFSYGSNYSTVVFGESSGLEPVTVIAGPSFAEGSERAKTALILLAVCGAVVLGCMHYLQSRYPNSRPSEFGATLFYTANFISNLPFLTAAAALTTAAAQTTSGPVQAAAPHSYVVAGGVFVALALAFNIATVIYVFKTEAANNSEFGPSIARAGACNTFVIILLSCLSPSALRLFDSGLFDLAVVFRPEMIDRIAVFGFASTAGVNAPLIAIEWMTGLVAGWAPETVVGFVTSVLALAIAVLSRIHSACEFAIRARSTAAADGTAIRRRGRASRRGGGGGAARSDDAYQYGSALSTEESAGGNIAMAAPPAAVHDLADAASNVDSPTGEAADADPSGSGTVDLL